MRPLRRFVGAAVLLLSVVGIVCCAAGAVGVWVFRQRASEKVVNVSARLEVGLQRASAANQDVRVALERARAAVAKVSKRSADLGGGNDGGRLASGFLRVLIREEVGPGINDLGGRLATCSDAAAAASSLLQSFQELSPGLGGRIRPDKLERLADQASQLSAGLQRLQGVVGDGDKQAAEKEVAAASSEVDAVLQKCQATVDDWQTDLDAAREELPRVKEEALVWLTRAAVGVTAMCVWVAVSQVSLLVHAWRWCRGA